MGITENLNSTVENIVEFVSGDTMKICKDAEKSNLSDWRNGQVIKATTLGAGAAAIPVAGYLTLPVDVAVTVRLMHRAATGICFLKLGEADDETFASVLAVWSGAVTLNETFAKQVAAKAFAAGAGTVGGTIGLKMAVQALSFSAGALVANKLGPKVAQKVAAKMAAKLATKAGTRWIPFISAIAGGTINWIMTDSLCNAAEGYCDFVKNIAARKS